MEARGSSWPWTGGLGSVLSSSHQVSLHFSLTCPLCSPSLRNINLCKWPRKCQLWLPRGSTNKPDLFPALQLFAGLLSNCFQKGEKNKAVKREIISLKLHLTPMSQATRADPAAPQFRWGYVKGSAKTTHTSWFPNYNKSVFPGKALKAAELFLINALTPVLRPLPQLASGSLAAAVYRNRWEELDWA